MLLHILSDIVLLRIYWEKAPLLDTFKFFWGITLQKLQKFIPMFQKKVSKKLLVHLIIGIFKGKSIKKIT